MCGLEAMRTALNLTQEEVAQAAEISRPAYCNIENGVRRPSPEVAQKIAKKLGFDWTMFYAESGAKEADPAAFRPDATA